MQARRRPQGVLRPGALALALLLVASCSGPTPHRAQPAPTASGPVCQVDRSPVPVPVGAVLVRGCVADEQHHPVAATVAIAHRAGILESLGTALSITASLGLCALPPQTCASDDGATLGVRTGADGRFQLLLPAGSGPATPGTSAAVVALPGGVTAQTTFHVDRDGPGKLVLLRPLRLWHPTYRIEVTGADLRVTFSDAPGSWDDHPRLAVGEVPLQSPELEVARGQDLDGHRLPPGKDELALVLHDGDVSYATAPTEVTVPDRSLARGHPCAVVTPGGRDLRTSDDGACLLTDGAWEGQGLDAISLCGDAFGTDACLGKGWALQVDLGAVRDVRDVVVPGLFGGGEVAASTDGRHWQPFAAVASGVTNPSTGVRGPVGARYLRVTGDQLDGVSEVAVF